MLKLSRVMAAILNFRSANDFLNFDQSEHIIGPESNVGFPISTKNTDRVYDHPMNISAKFGSNLFCGFRIKDENVKFP